jgi:hypothetical protein
MKKLSMTLPVLIAMALSLQGLALQAASPVPAQLPRPDGKPGDAKKPVKVYIMSGQSNMIGFGTPSGAVPAYNSIYLTADPDASFGPFAIFLGGDYKIAPLGIYVSADPGAAKGASGAVYKGAYDAAKDYSKEQPVKTETVALGVSKGLLPVTAEETCVVKAFIEVPEAGNYICNPGFGNSTFSVMMLDGKEVYRRNIGAAAVRQKVSLEAGKRYPISITYFKGGSTALWLRQEDLVGHGDLESVTQRDKMFPWLIDDAGKWTVRNDVYYFEARGSFKGSPLSPTSNGGKGIGPELGFGHVMGTFHDEQVLLIKVAMGNRALNFDFRPPSSGRTQPTNNFETLEYKLLVEGVHKTLDGISTNLPGYAGQGYEIAGFVWWQGHKDKGDPKEEYEKHLVNLINDLRKEFKSPKMPVAIATVAFHGYEIETGPWKGIWEAQMAVGDPKQHPEFAGTVASVDARGYWREADESPGGADYHYNLNAETYMLTGDALGRAMVQMLGEKAEALPYGNRPKPVVAAQAQSAPQELDEAAKAAKAKAAQKALEPVILDGMLSGFIANPRNNPALVAGLKGEKPKNVSQFLRDSVDTVNNHYVAAGIQDYEWHAFGSDLNNVEWECFSFDPPEALDKTKDAGRYRKVTYPDGMENWFASDFDAAKAGWKKGLPPFGNKDGKLEPLGTCTQGHCLCGVAPRTLWEKEVLLIRGTFDIPAFKAGHRYRVVVGGSNHVMAGEGYAIYVNGKLLAESKTGVPNRAGGQPRGGHVYADLRGEFAGGKVTLAATSFQQFNRRGAAGKPMGHLTVWIEEQKLPPVE